MKTYCLFVALFMFTLNFSSGEIKNGYARDINSVRESLKGLYALLLDENKMTASEKRIVESKVKELVNYVTYYELTENLLEQFRLIDSGLYNEIDTIKDRHGRSTDVYIKFIPAEQARVQAWGITNIAQVTGDDDAYRSEYGERTVSVKIWIVSKALLVLAHELGHIKYQVPNLASYIEYHRLNYRPGIAEPNNIGHDPNDKSGRNAASCEKEFRENYNEYLKNGYHQVESPLDLVENIRKEVRHETLAAGPLAML